MPPSDFKKLKVEMSCVIFQLAMLHELRNTHPLFVDTETSDGDDNDDSLLSLLVILRQALDRVRYSVDRKNVVRSVAHHALLYNLRDDEFRKFIRVSKITFNVLVEMIHQDIVFKAKGDKAKKQQRDVALQLAITLEWYGAYGNGNSVAHLVRDYAVGMGTVPTYVRRVQKALLRHYTTCVSWPSQQQRALSAAFHEERFGLTEGVVGFVDGTHVNFSQKPHIQGSLHYSQKCQHSLNVQTPIAKHPERYFSGDEYLIGDTGYALSIRLITPYKLPAAAKDEHAFYNETISSARVINETCIGLLKNRWMSLKEIRTQIKKKADFRHVNNHILACVLLHNLGLALADEWDEDTADEEDDDEPRGTAEVGTAAQQKRERIKRALISTRQEHLHQCLHLRDSLSSK
ncbi:hypothetical protein PPTG_10128 [Phytophthora nicotianae INRA-310]|uniref:DDE Tnp4 domain-containing protein n=1 Tax=Phytophthora nicotianae (strain INRA-310) TaxID=761204 RepID=W2QE76_PHYN3|nr:hypothetical protein PPTG_10128 [Phytophthora nicotianae INRA-310]ETN11176.1 hypothetical protein PPTG_10128 [Phytophthora nicotianae INRA-310]